MTAPSDRNDDTVTVDRVDGVGRIVMDRAERHNAMSEAMAQAIAAGAGDLATDDTVRAIVLVGTAGVFNTGADLSTFDGDATDRERLDAIATPLHETIRTLSDAPKPILTGVDGVVAGGGLGLALSGDVLLASEEARFEYAYPKIGLSGDGGATWFLPRLLGRRRAQAFAFLDEPIGPEEAVDLGLATETVPADAFDARLEELAAELANGPTRAYAEIKTLFTESGTNDLGEHLTLERERIATLAETDDYAAGLSGFLDDEEPSFEGR